LSAVFHWQELPSGPVNSVNGPSKPANNFGTVTLNLGAGAEGKTYQFQVQTNDGYDSSPWSAWCQFTVDTAAPPKPDVTPTASGTAPVYPFCDPSAINSCTPVGGPGIAGAFTFSEPAGGQDTIRYVYGWDTPGTSVTVSAGAASPAILLTPPHYGLNKLMVFSLDGAGHASATRVFTILVGDPDGSSSAAKAFWPLDSIDSHGFTDQVSQSALTTTGVAWTNDARYMGAQAATFNGSTGEGTQSVPSFDTSGSFSVAAWVRASPSCTNSNEAAVSMDADTVTANNHSGPFILGLDCVNMRWRMRVSASNVPAANLLEAFSPNGSAVFGRWTFLVGVFDENLNQVQLWVNGTLVQTTTATTSWVGNHGAGWKATGPVVLGRYRINDGNGGRFAGEIADVRLWNRVVVADDVNGTVADPNNRVPAHPGLTTPLQVGSWQFSDGMCFCAQALDGSVFSRPLTVAPDFAADPNWNGLPTAAWLVDGGNDGDGALQLDGQAGSASTTDDLGTLTSSDDVARPVLVTDQSFSLQVWANPSALNATDQYVLSQATGAAKAFRLYLRGSDHKWVFEVSTPDGAGGYTWATSVSDATAVAGVFTRLGAVFNAATGATRLVVNGVYQSMYAATGGGGWRSTGSLVVGSGNAFAGTIDDIDVWQGGPAAGITVAPTVGRPLPSIVGGGGWVLNGSAAMAGSDLVLTPADYNKAGSAVYSTPTASNGLRAEFTVQIGGGGGADGMTFAMLNAATNTPHSLGGAGGGLGFAGLSGVAVTFDTYQNGSDPSNNFVGLATDTGTGQLTLLATATNVPNLRTGAHAVVVAVAGTSVTVKVDGIQVISATASVPASVLPAFTGGTGGLADQHTVRAITITSGGTALPAPDDGWRFNGSAAVNGSSVVLTPAQVGVAGAALYARPVATDGLTASFTLSMNGGSGADGTTFALLDPASTTPASVGGGGGGLGFAGLGGVAAEFITYPQGGVSSNNFVAVATSTAGAQQQQLVATNTNVPNLRSGTHPVVVRVAGTTVTISVDGAQVLSTSVPSLPSSAIVGFTAGTGGSTDVHAVSNVQVTTAANVVPAASAAGWQNNGSATTNGGTIQLTAATEGQVGTSIFGKAIPTANLDARFTIQIGGGTGADGLAFMLLDPAQTSPTSLGDAGGGLGFEGLAGVAVTFITCSHPGYPSANFVGISTGGSNTTLTFAGTSTNVPDLRTGTHAVEVTNSPAGHLVVTVDGVQVLDVAIAVPANAFVGFSGGNGSLTDVHAVSGVGIAY
jgi:hypothetical protein